MDDMTAKWAPNSENDGPMLVVIKLPYLKSSILCSKLSKGMGHNYYGEPA